LKELKKKPWGVDIEDVYGMKVDVTKSLIFSSFFRNSLLIFSLSIFVEWKKSK
jgi:hypothetical protein